MSSVRIMKSIMRNNTFKLMLSKQLSMHIKNIHQYDIMPQSNDIVWIFVYYTFQIKKLEVEIPLLLTRRRYSRWTITEISTINTTTAATAEAITATEGEVGESETTTTATDHKQQQLLHIIHNNNSSYGRSDNSYGRWGWGFWNKNRSHIWSDDRHWREERAIYHEIDEKIHWHRIQ